MRSEGKVCETVTDHDWSAAVIERAWTDGLGRAVNTKRRQCSRCGRTQRYDERYDERPTRGSFAALYQELP